MKARARINTFPPFGAEELKKTFSLGAEYVVVFIGEAASHLLDNNSMLAWVSNEHLVFTEIDGEPPVVITSNTAAIPTATVVITSNTAAIPTATVDADATAPALVSSLSYNPAGNSNEQPE